MLVNKFFVFLLLGMFMISMTSAWSSSTFNNSLSTENITFTNRIIDAEYNWTFEGTTSSNPIDWAVDEDGGTYAKIYNAVPQFHTLIQHHNISKGGVYNWSETVATGETSNITTFCYNYNALAWEYIGNKSGGGNTVYTQQYSIPSNCSTTSILSIKDYIWEDGATFVVSYYEGWLTPLNNSVRFLTIPDGTFITNGFINLTGYQYNNSNLTNLYLEIGTPDGTYEWNQTGELNSTNSPQKTSNLASAINTYLSTATAVGGYYLVPFLFHSDTAGILKYSGLDFNSTGFIENSQTYTATTSEFSDETFAINISYYSSAYSGTINGYLVYNGTSYLGTKSGTGNTVTYSKSITIPEVTADTNVSFYWTFTGIGMDTNSSSNNQTIQNLSFDDCSVYTNLLYNFSLREEETNTILNETENNTLIEVDLYLSPRDETSQDFHYFNSYTQENPALVCSNINIGTDRYSVDMIAGYQADDYVREFYYVDRGDATNETQNVSLMDLLATDSTTFLFEYTDENEQKVQDIIVHTFRKYIGEGLYREVERSKGDNSGQTHVHLVEEDVIYYFMITKYGETLFISDEYNAKCLSTPCTIILSASDTPQNWSMFDNEGGKYIVTPDKDARTVTITFNLNSTGLVNASVYKMWNVSGVPELVDTGSLNSIAGSIELDIPLSYGNVTYFVSIYRDNEFIKSSWVSMEESGIDYFGTFGAILGGLIVLAMMLMAVAEGVGFIVITILAVIIIGVMQLVDLGWMAIISIICAGAVIIWKLINRRGTRQ